MDSIQVSYSDLLYRRRLLSLITVDDILSDLLQTINEIGELEDTLIFFTSDHGYHLGQNGLGLDKRLPYETDIRVPFVAIGPGIPSGVEIADPILNIDLFPTFLEVAGIPIPDDIDGMSIFKHLQNISSNSSQGRREDFLVEYHGEQNDGGWSENITSNCSIPMANMNCYSETQYGTPPFWDPSDFWFCSCQDSTNNTFNCLRILSWPDTNVLYCEFFNNVTENSPPLSSNLSSDEDPNVFLEFYDLSIDPWQTHNAASTLNPEAQIKLHQRLHQLKTCSGQTCQTLPGDDLLSVLST